MEHHAETANLAHGLPGSAEMELRILWEELGATNTNEALRAIRFLRSKTVSGLVTDILPTPDNPEGGEAVAGLPDPRVAVEKIRDFASKVAALNGTVASMEDQLKSLYADRERLEREIGASEVDDIIEAFRNLQTTIRSMETQLMTLYAGREMLDVELGRSDPEEIVAMFRNVARLVNVARQELATIEDDARAVTGAGVN
jgi:hypothetical protein